MCFKNCNGCWTFLVIFILLVLSIIVVHDISKSDNLKFKNKQSLILLEVQTNKTQTIYSPNNIVSEDYLYIQTKSDESVFILEDGSIYSVKEGVLVLDGDYIEVE